MKTKSYKELILLPTFIERFNYLKLPERTPFDSKRFMNQFLYQSEDWRRVRRQVITRDNGLDLAINPIPGRVAVHHINPITIQDIIDRNEKIFDMDNLITVSHDTHNAIHLCDEGLLQKDWVPRSPNDTVPWR